MASVYYHTVGGKVRGETGATRRDYLTDALGSVTGTVDQASQVENVYRYKPYGGTLYKSGSAEDPRLRWTGDTGSRTTGDRYAGQYNRARHYGTGQGQWTTVDPLWPEESAYGYAGGNPVSLVDPRGLPSRLPLTSPEVGPLFPPRMEQDNPRTKSPCEQAGIAPAKDPSGCRCCIYRVTTFTTSPCTFLKATVDYWCIREQCGMACADIARTLPSLVRPCRIFGRPADVYIGIFPDPVLPPGSDTRLRLPAFRGGIVIKF